MSKPANADGSRSKTGEFPVYDGRGEELIRVEKPPPGAPLPSYQHMALVALVFVAFIALVLVIRRS